VAIAFALLAPLSALAELSDETLLGLGLRSQPAYDGSASQRLGMVPVIRYLGQPLFVRSTQGVLEGGVRLELVPGLHAGPQLAYEPGRKTNDSDFLQTHGVSNVDAGASVGVHVEWDHMFGPVPFTLLARARQNANADHGAQLDLRLSAGAYRGGRVGAGVFAQTTWANAKSTGSLYDVTAQQSAASGLPVFRAAGGWLFSSFGLLWSIDLNRDWLVVGSMESRHLRGDAARSPIGERASNYYASGGLAYRF
jgi:outer membrane scaffolding protein for murein synthesis (MipA/OmpV family)